MNYDPIFIVRCGALDLTSSSHPRGVSLKHTEKSNGGKECEIIIDNANLELIDNPNVQEGKLVQWRFGYGDQLSELYEGQLMEVEPNFDAASGLTITLRIYDAVAQLLKRKRQKVWKSTAEGKAEITESEVVARIAKDLGLKAKVELTRIKYSQLTQSDYDWDYIQQLAGTARAVDGSKNTPYTVYVDTKNSTLHFEPMKLKGNRKHSYRYFNESENPKLISFNPKSQGHKPDNNASDTTSVKDITPQSAAKPTVQAATSNTGNGSRQTLGAYTLDLNTTAWVKNPSNESPGKANLAGEQKPEPRAQDLSFNTNDANTAAENAHQTSEMDKVVADIVVIGDPTIQANSLIEVLGVGKKYSGLYYADEVVHELANGYITSVGLRRNAISSSTAANSDVGGNNVSPQAAAAKSTGPQSTQNRVVYDPNKAEFKP